MNSPKSSTLLLSLVALSCTAACGEKKEAFTPGELQPYEENSIGFSIQKPAAVNATVEGSTVTFTAEGFTTVTVTLNETQDSAGTGSSGGTRGVAYRRKVIVPRRELVCESKDVGKFAGVVEAMCKSLKNTVDAPKSPKVVFKDPEITGLKDNTYAGAVKDLMPVIEECWKTAVTEHADFPAGSIGINITFDEAGAYKQSGHASSFGRGYDHKPLTTCIYPKIKDLKPTPEGGEVNLAWQIKFELY